MVRTTYRTILSFIVAAGLALPMGAAGQSMADVEAKRDISERDMDTFVDVYVDAFSEIEQLMGSMQDSGDDPERTQQLQAEANEAINDVIERSPMSVEEYTSIVMAMEDDEALRERFEQRISERHGN